MAEVALGDDVARVVEQAEALARAGSHRAAIDLLTATNRSHPDSRLELALLAVRREGGAPVPGSTSVDQAPIEGEAGDGTIYEVAGADLSVAALRTGLARSGCLWVRGLIDDARVAHLTRGIDAAFAAYDAVTEGAEDVDPGWYTPCSMPDRTGGGLPEKVRRVFMRRDGGLVTADSPRMLVELLELVDEVGIGALMTEFLGERPLLSANKCTLRRIEPTDVMGGWHQDGAFLGDAVGSFNLWLALSDCGTDAPGMDIVPTRIPRVIPSDEESQFDWSLSERAVREAAADAPIVRPQFRAGDALLFDHRLVHRTAASAQMTRARYAIESWFFAPSAYPVGQLPLLY
ncbi:MAG: phytanoyl-CoA dioxygenase family protein [Acidimicrobiales bacterium]